jgi:hypothetical protein
MSNVRQIRAVLGFSKFNNEALVSRASAISAGMANNQAFPNPPVGAEALKAAVDAYSAAIADALDGSKRAAADRDKKRVELIEMLRHLASYVERECKGDVTIFLSSGFEIATTVRRNAQPLAQPGIVRLDQGTTGQLLVTIKGVLKARAYELRYAPIDIVGQPGTWTPLTVARVKQPTAINNLTPGTAYAFQVRAFGLAGHTDWSDLVSRMCI